MVRLNKEYAANRTDVDGSGVYIVVILCLFRSKLELSCVFYFVLYLKESACVLILDVY